VIPQEIIIVDNASTDGTAEWVKTEADLRYFRNLSNLGCGIARNQGARHAKSKLLLFLDNDQFVSVNSIQKLKDGLKNFMAVGIDSWIMEGSGYPRKTQFVQSNPHAYIGGGGMLIYKAVFDYLGGFDDRYAPLWYEDSDFCFRMKDTGYLFNVVSDANILHLGGVTSSRIPVEKEERRKLFLDIWGHCFKHPGVIGKKKRIAILVDSRGWAWDYKSQQVVKYLSNEFDFDTFYMSEEKDDFHKHIFGYDLYFTFDCNFIRRLPDVIVKNERVITGVTSHTYQNFPSYAECLYAGTALHANSMLLFNQLLPYGKKVYYLPNGVDHELFTPTKNKNTGTLIAGYVGKSTFRKGLEPIILPVIKATNIRFIGAVGKVTDNKIIPREKMPDYYNQIDFVIIASDMDGTPNQLLEAASCGRTFIANEIGNVPEFANGVNGVVVKKRDITNYIDIINHLKDKRSRVIEMGNHARETVVNGWTWAHQSENYRSMFRSVLAL
jgi:glycosyltransferase involved in cell wall biosynthesis